MGNWFEQQDKMKEHGNDNQESKQESKHVATNTFNTNMSGFTMSDMMNNSEISAPTIGSNTLHQHQHHNTFLHVQPQHFGAQVIEEHKFLSDDDDYAYGDEMEFDFQDSSESQLTGLPMAIQMGNIPTMSSMNAPKPMYNNNAPKRALPQYNHQNKNMNVNVNNYQNNINTNF